MSRLTVRDRLFILGPIFLTIGLAILLSSVGRWSTAWGGDRQTATVGSHASAGDPLAGTWHTIRVGDQTHRCAGKGKNPQSRARVDVVFDPEDPSHCRAAKLKGRLSTYEIIGLAIATKFTLFGGLITALLVGAWRRRQRAFAELD